MDTDRLHDTASVRLGKISQRYTSSRRHLVELLARAEYPVTIGDILTTTRDLPQSSVYRNLTVLCTAGVARRLGGTDDLGRFELAEDLAGHHDHLSCISCGALVDYEVPPGLERALSEAAEQASSERGFEISGHRLDFEGLCPECQHPS